MEWFFKWFASEISEKENQDAAERLYYLALLSVRNLLAACEARPDLYRPIAKHQLYWPSMTGWGADVERTNKELMVNLRLVCKSAPKPPVVQAALIPFAAKEIATDSQGE